MVEHLNPHAIKTPTQIVSHLLELKYCAALVVFTLLGCCYSCRLAPKKTHVNNRDSSQENS